MKKRIALAMALILALATVFVLASCGGDEGCKNHTYSSEYTIDANGHWYVSTCGCEGEVANYGAHKDEDTNGKCDVCEYVLCAHTFSEEWSSDENGHYHASTCDCAPQKADEAAHVDENKDGICDVCQYVVCSHKYASDWSSDETNHWKAPVCGCEVDPDSFGAHADENKDGNCDICAYVLCAHTFSEEWSSDGAYHWYAATCGCDVVKDKAEHEAGEDETICGACGANICKHTYEETLSYDDTHHWYAASCGCDVIKDKTEHTWSSAWEKDGTGHWHKTECGCDVTSAFGEHYDSEDEDARCDTCGQIDFASLIGNIDEYIGEERNEISVQDNENDPIYGYNIPKVYSVKVFDNYILFTNAYGKKYISYCGENNDKAFIMNVENGGSASRDLDFDDSSMIDLEGVCKAAAGTSLEEYLIALYNLGVSESSSGFNYVCDEENSKYSFSFLYDAGYTYAYAVVEFTLDEERMGVTSLTLNEQRYETYVPGDDNVVTYIVTQTVTQGFGAPYDSSAEPNPYPASEYLFTELELYNQATNEKITDGCVVTIAPGYANGLTLVVGDSQAEFADFNRYTTEASGLEIGWGNYPVFMYSTATGEYEVTVSNELASVSFKVVVVQKAPTSIKPAVVIDDEKKNVKEFEIYAGLDFIIGALASNAAESPAINKPIVTNGDASKLTFTKDGDNWITVASAAGEYELMLVSALDETIATTLSLKVVSAPSAKDILNGYYEIKENDMGLTGSVKFVPTEADVANGTATVKFKIAGNPMLGEQDQSFESTVSYSFENGAIVLSGATGDDISQFSFVISERHELVLVRTPFAENPDYIEEYALEIAEEVIIKDPTQNPFTMSVTETYVYSRNDDYIFVAGEAGKYVFYIPKGYGFYVNRSNQIIDSYDNVEGKQFSLDLKAGQEVTFTPKAAEVGEFLIYFYIEKETKITDANGLGGKYTFTLGLEYELTFSPSESGATSGVLTVKDPINGKNSGSFSYTIVDGDYQFGEDAGIFITKDLGGNWFFQNPSVNMPQQFSGPTSYVEPTIEEIPYNGYKDENELGGIYTVTVLGNEYKIIIVPSTDGGAAGLVQIYNPVSGKYSDAYSYTIEDYEYVIDIVGGIQIYRDLDGSWLVKAEGLDGVKFAEKTVVPVVQELVLGSNKVVLTDKDAQKGGKTLLFTPESNGKYTITSANLTIKVLYDGVELDLNEVELDATKTYTVIASANEATTYYISVAKKASGGIVDDDGNIGTPEEEL